jgi:hypothetical protein
MRRLYGAKAFDSFRYSHAPIHMARAAAWNPSYSVPSLLRSAFQRVVSR